MLTRPASQGLRFAAQVEAELGPMAVVQTPLLWPVFLKVMLPSLSFSAMILTSETGVEAARRISATGQALPGRAYCVGDHTAAAARAAGFEPLSAGGDAGALVAMIRAGGERGPLLHLRGEQSRGGVSESLNSAGIVTFETVVYRQISKALSPEATNVLQGDVPVIVPLFSPRSAKVFVMALPDPIQAPLWIAALSPAVAAALGRLEPARMVVADAPDAPHMLRAVEALLATGAAS